LKGWIGVQDHGARIEIRDLRVLEAPEGTGLDAWLRPPPLCAAAALLDRIMNPERLSLPDGIHSGVVATRVSGNRKEDHVLADLAGPGALVRIARSNNEGRLAFYFDGQERPTLEVKPDELWKVVPQVAEDPNPVLTLLAYRKSLRVVLREAKRAEYRLDYVTFPESLPVRTFRRDDFGIPRGWLSAVAYRHGQCWWGVHREFDPLPRLQSPQETIKPGRTARLLRVEGAGVVLWLKLRASKRVLDNDDLWLHVTVDGEAQPAISAPARYWFPGLAGQENYPNFLMTDRGGVTTLLAMPYGNGLEVSATNRGSRSIGPVGVTLSVEPAAQQDCARVAGRMRLRGLFLRGNDAQTQWFSQDGTGRWIGMVYQQPAGKPTQIDSLLVDGKPAPGWPAWAAGLFLGQNGDFRRCASGRRGELCWRYLLMEPIDFQKSLVLRGAALGDRLVLFYMAKPPAE